MKKRIVAILLMVMVVVLLPTTALAGDGFLQPQTPAENYYLSKLTRGRFLINSDDIVWGTLQNMT